VPGDPKNPNFQYVAVLTIVVSDSSPCGV